MFNIVTNNFFIVLATRSDERGLECQKLYNYFTLNGWMAVNDIRDADFVIFAAVFYLCYEDDNCIDVIKHYARKMKRSARVVITGCMPDEVSLKLSKICDFTFIPPTDLDKLDQMLKSRIKFSEVKDVNRIEAKQIFYRPIIKRLLISRAKFIRWIEGFRINRNIFFRAYNYLLNLFWRIIFVKAYINPQVLNYGSGYFYLMISRGCLRTCSYCIIKEFIGNVKSKPQTEILGEFRHGLSLGEKVFSLVSEDAGCYGLDLQRTSAELLKELFSTGKNSDFKLIIPNFSAQWFIEYYEELEDIFTENVGKVSYFHIPIQSGSQKILNKMNRNYNIKDVKESLRRLQKRTPNLNLGTDIIVGFPGETEEDFLESKHLLNDVRFKFVDIFQYEDRPGTVSSNIDLKISVETQGRRKRELLKIQNTRVPASVLLSKVQDITSNLF